MVVSGQEDVTSAPFSFKVRTDLDCAVMEMGNVIRTWRTGSERQWAKMMSVSTHW